MRAREPAATIAALFGGRCSASDGVEIERESKQDIEPPKALRYVLSGGRGISLATLPSRLARIRSARLICPRIV